MHIKRFEAPTLLEAVRRVKEELGPEALVLSTRRVRRDAGVFGWFGRSLVEVVAAVDREARRRDPSSPPLAEPDPSWKGLSLTKSLVDPLEGEIRALRRSLEARGRDPEQEAMRRAIAELRRSVADLGRRMPDPGPSLDGVGARLLAAGLAPRHAEALAEAAARRLREEQGKEAQGSGWDRVPDVLAERLEPRLVPLRPDGAGGPQLFVGATGVGKTTTLAKVAARGDASRPPALFTTDTWRVGADEQLRAFAGRLGVPFEVAASPEDLGRRLERLRDRPVLVDTAGRGRGDPGALPDLRRFREALGRGGHVHLVVSATTKADDLCAQLERFAPLRPDSLIVAKVDESEALANIANLVLDERTPPLRWLGTGQRVPEDLAVPDPSDLAARMLGAGA